MGNGIYREREGNVCVGEGLRRGVGGFGLLAAFSCMEVTSSVLVTEINLMVGCDCPRCAGGCGQSHVSLCAQGAAVGSVHSCISGTRYVELVGSGSCVGGSRVGGSRVE